MTVLADGIVAGSCQRFMRVMTCDASQRPFRFLKTWALVEIDGLMARVPGIGPIRVLVRFGRFTMAVAAKFIHRGCV